MLQPTPFRLVSPDDGVDVSEWKSCMSAWESILHSYLALSSQRFAAELEVSDALPKFLISYLQELSRSPQGRRIYQPSKAMNRDCFLLIHRAWYTATVPSTLVLPPLLVEFCHVFGTIKGSSEAIDRLWKEKSLAASQEMLKHKLSLQKALESVQQADRASLDSLLSGIRAFIKSSHEFGKFLMIGADFLDALITAWDDGDSSTRQKVTLITYSALLTLMSDETGGLSTLADHLYTLRMCHKQASSGSSLLAAMITTTPFLFKYRNLATRVKTARITDMLPTFEGMGAPPRKHPISKGKEVDYNGIKETHMVQTMKISQVQELFPDFGAGFIARLLEEYEQNPELVIQHLLDNSIPPHLQALDKEESLESYHKLHSGDLRERSALSTSRHNIYDFDDLDELEVAAGKLHIGKKNDTVLSEPANKASILSALAALDPDDDERDDTYDAEDVGGTVDMVKPDDDLADRKEQPGEEQLFATWMATPEAFGRDSSTRASAERTRLRQDTGLTDEAIEGWAIMLEREPQRLRRLKAQYALPSMLQPELASSSWKSGAESDQDDSRRPKRGGSARGRGRSSHRGNRGRGGSAADAAGPSNEAPTQRARQKKDASKSSRANHSRRDQRAKKVARAGFG